MEVLTLDELKAMEPGIFREGTIIDSPEGINMMNTERMLRWVAVRGSGIEDWAIYCHYAEHDTNYVRRQGDKVNNEHHIKKLVPCTDEAYEMYRR